MKFKPLYIGIGVFAGLFLLRKLFMDVWDKSSWPKIQTLEPDTAKKAIAFLNAAEKEGILLRVIAAKRTCEEQNALYAQGRTKPGKVVTNARCNESMHNFGLAIDVVEIKNGEPLWVNDRWAKIGQIGKSVGFEWGGDWKFTDKPHFQNTRGLSLAQIQKLPQDKKGNAILG